MGALGVAGAAGVAAVTLAGDEEETPPEAKVALEDETLPEGEAPDLVEELDTVAVEGDDEIPVVEAEAPAPEEEPLSDDEIPDWLRDLGVTEVTEAAEPPALDDEVEVETDVLPVMPVDEADLESEQPAFEEEAPP
ncbi:MAG: hypothetical protein GWO24_30010, partial [Akkermansiaceae bacterium]|nr:hypothetical protein [Akkermansiaceae bacterium]